MTVAIAVFGSSLSLRISQLYLCNIPYYLRIKISDFNCISFGIPVTTTTPSSFSLIKMNTLPQNNSKAALTLAIKVFAQLYVS